MSLFPPDSLANPQKSLPRCCPISCVLYHPLRSFLVPWMACTWTVPQKGVCVVCMSVWCAHVDVWVFMSVCLCKYVNIFDYASEGWHITLCQLFWPLQALQT